METNGIEGNAYRVIYSGKVRDNIRGFAKRARKRGLSSQFAVALERIDVELHRDPRTFGDPHYRLPIANFTVYGRIERPLVVTFAVSDEQNIVFVLSFAPYPPEAF